MPVLFTIHSYRSWDADNPRGYVRLREGVLPPDPEMARQYDRHARQPQVRFEISQHPVLIDGCRDICSRRGWRLHQVVVVTTHVHPLISWRDPKLGWCEVRRTLKRLLGWMLAKHTRVEGKRWLGHRGSRKRVRDRHHFDHLMQTYLPNHSRGRRGGSGWREDLGYFGKAYQIANR